MEQTLPPCFYRISIKALVLNNEGRFLLVQEENWLWELPGGGIDIGEEPRECLTREIREEMWLEVISIREIPSYFYTSTSLKGRPIANVLYETTLKDYDFTPSEECQKIEFFTVEEALKLNTYPNIQEFLKHFTAKNHGNF